MLNEFKNFIKEQKNDDFFLYEWSTKTVKRGKQIFAIFGSIAYDVTKLKFYPKSDIKGTGRLCISIKGNYFAQFCNEGESGILGMYIISRKGKIVKVFPTFVCCSWIYTSELQLTNEEIEENIINDIAEGKNVITKKPSGWL